jgi:aspartate carbamoyltransferase catalytic subunit
MKHLLSAADLSRAEALAILDNADRFSQALLGQSLLRRLNWWKIDNVRNAIELEFTGSF